MGLWPRKAVLVLIGVLSLSLSGQRAIALPGPTSTDVPVAPEDGTHSDEGGLPTATATIAPEICISNQEFEREVRALLSYEVGGMMPTQADCQDGGDISELTWEVSDGAHVLSSGSVRQERNVPTGFVQLTNEDVQCLLDETEVASGDAGLVTPVAVVEGGRTRTGDEQSGDGQYGAAPPADADDPSADESTQEGTPPAPDILPPVPDILPPVPDVLPSTPGGTNGTNNTVTCCSYGYALPGDPGGDRFCKPHADRFNWNDQGCDHIINCRMQGDNLVHGPNPWVFTPCYDRRARRLYPLPNDLDSVYQRLGCTNVKHLTLHHSNPQWGPRDCTALVNCLPELPGQQIDIYHQQLGCSTWGNPRTRCARGEYLVKLFKDRCDANKGDVRMVVLGKQTDLWIPAGSSIGNCNWNFPTGFCTDKNSPAMRKIVVTKDGFVICRLKNGKWQDYPEYCPKKYPHDRTGDPNKPDSLKCSNLF